MNAFSLVTFECSHPTGEHELHVVGDHPALGCWDVSRSVPLLGEGQQRTSLPVSVPCSVPLQYKYVLCASGHLVRWESIEGNRTLVPGRAEFSVCDQLDDVMHSATLPATLQPMLPPMPPPMPPPVPAQLPPMVPEGAMTPTYQQPGASSNPDSAVLVVCYILPVVISKSAVGWAIEWNQV